MMWMGTLTSTWFASIVIGFIYCNWQGMFGEASLFNGDISSWDVSKVTAINVSIICEYCVQIMKHVLWESSMCGDGHLWYEWRQTHKGRLNIVLEWCEWIL